MIITGVQPAQKNDTDNNRKMASFKPYFPFGSETVSGWFTKQSNIYLGTYSMGTFSLQQCYAEHLVKRNRWSQSNCGFDLARYAGTKIYFIPHAIWDYIVFIDPEYRTFDFFRRQCMHPAVLLTHPQARLIRSIKNGGPRKKLPRMWVPSPSTITNGWQWMHTLATTGLFAWHVTWVDLERPWVGTVQNPNAVRWWESGSAQQNPDWFTTAVNFQAKDPKVALDLYYTGISQESPDLKQLDNGPLTLKGVSLGERGALEYPQLTWFYKAYFEWGGSTTTFKTVCDPANKS